MRGGCLCGEVRYEIRGEPRSLTHCHCAMCRKAHGAAFATFIEISADDFQLVRGADRLVRFASSPDSVRPFCPRCGSTLFFQTDGEDEVWIAAGSLDGDAAIAPSVPRSHSYVASKAPWLHLADELPRFDGEVE